MFDDPITPPFDEPGPDEEDGPPFEPVACKGGLPAWEGDCIL
jgi:hypothetical protein